MIKAVKGAFNYFGVVGRPLWVIGNPSPSGEPVLRILFVTKVGDVHWKYAHLRPSVSLPVASAFWEKNRCDSSRSKNECKRKFDLNHVEQKKCESMFSDQRKSLCVLPQWPIAWPLLLLVVESRNIMMRRLGRPSAYRQQFAPDSYYHLSPTVAVTEQYKFGWSNWNVTVRQKSRAKFAGNFRVRLSSSTTSTSSSSTRYLVLYALCYYGNIPPPRRSLSSQSSRSWSSSASRLHHGVILLLV